VLQVCLNGARAHSVPLTPDELAVAARDAVAAGATDIHLHPKSSSGQDTLAAPAVAAAVAAVRSAVAGVTIGVTTGAWTGSTVERAADIRMWTVLPDHASVNWHEDGAEQLAEALLARGVAVHAGIFSGTSGAARLRRSALLARVSRILAEVVPPALDVGALLASLAGLEPPVLLHGEDEAAWPVLRHAQAVGLDTRIGLEDTLTLPDGTPAPDNAALVRAALAS